MEMTDMEFNATSRGLALATLDTCHRRGIGKDDTANVISAAAAEALAQLLGPVSAVERLRDVADLLERQVLTA